MTTVKELKKINTLEGLEKLGIGSVYCDIGHRGGGIGFYSDDVAVYFGISVGLLPNKFGAGCNYLGGGMRGSIFGSGFSTHVTLKISKLLTALAQACVRVYENVENDNSMNEDEYEDGETNWDVAATKASRKAGIKSAY